MSWCSFQQDQQGIDSSIVLVRQTHCCTGGRSSSCSCVFQQPKVPNLLGDAALISSESSIVALMMQPRRILQHQCSESIHHGGVMKYKVQTPANTHLPGIPVLWMPQRQCMSAINLHGHLSHADRGPGTSVPVIAKRRCRQVKNGGA